MTIFLAYLYIGIFMYFIFNQIIMLIINNNIVLTENKYNINHQDYYSINLKE